MGFFRVLSMLTNSFRIIVFFVILGIIGLIILIAINWGLLGFILAIIITFSGSAGTFASKLHKKIKDKYAVKLTYAPKKLIIEYILEINVWVFLDWNHN